MLTRLQIAGFKLFERVDIELADRVVFVGPNNSGKTSALQALALWDIGAKRWIEKRGAGAIPEKRPGVTINRRDLIAVPVPSANLLWRDLRTQQQRKAGGTDKIYITVNVEGIDGGEPWTSGLEFYYANEESLYCRALPGVGGERQPVPGPAAALRVAYLPPMSGLSPTETRLDEGAINVRMGEGRTAEVLRNLCWQVLQGPNGSDRWRRLVDQVDHLFGTKLEQPVYVAERGEITLAYRTRSGIRLDVSSAGRGQQQTLLLLAHMAVHPGAVLLLDEPDAHLEILRQRQIYHVLTETASETGSQIIAASHSEVILNEAADRDVVVAFVGTPHRIDDRGSQVLKSLQQIGFDQYYQAEDTGWVLYLEGSTDLAIMKAFADRMGHPAAKDLERPFVSYVGNQPMKAQEHFHGLREAKQDLVGVAIYDRLDREPPMDPTLTHLTWRRREIESYLDQRETLRSFAAEAGRTAVGDLLSATWVATMDAEVDRIADALAALGRGGPWDHGTKATDDFLDPLFAAFYKALSLPNLMRKTDYHRLAAHVPIDAIDPEVTDKLDAIHQIAQRAKPRT